MGNGGCRVSMGTESGKHPDHAGYIQAFIDISSLDESDKARRYQIGGSLRRLNDLHGHTEIEDFCMDINPMELFRQEAPEVAGAFNNLIQALVASVDLTRRPNS